MNQPTTKLLTSLLILIALGLGAWGVYASQNTKDTSPAANTVQTEVSETPEAGRTEITYLAEPGITSLEQLKREAKDVVVTESEYGELVESIEGHKGGVGGAYWSFYVNGEMAQVGAGTYVQQEGDFIEWKFQKL